MKLFVLSATAAHLTHFFFEWLALGLGMQICRWQRKQLGMQNLLQGTNFSIVIGCLAGAAIGNKLVFWLEYPNLWPSFALNINALMSGQSIVGGLLGGLLGIEIAKKLIGVTYSTGDQFVFPIIVGTFVGRIGCFLAGLNDATYGTPTSLPWGIDFGDGISHHPTQIYEMLFVSVFWLVLRKLPNRLAPQPGLYFKLFLSSYLIWRLAIDGIKPVPFEYPIGLSGIQIVCIIALIVYSPFVFKQVLQLNKHEFNPSKSS